MAVKIRGIIFPEEEIVKKILVLFLVFMMLFSFIGCAANPSSGNKADSDATSDETTDDTTGKTDEETSADEEQKKEIREAFEEAGVKASDDDVLAVFNFKNTYNSTASLWSLGYYQMTSLSSGVDLSKYGDSDSGKEVSNLIYELLADSVPYNQGESVFDLDNTKATGKRAVVSAEGTLKVVSSSSGNAVITAKGVSVKCTYTPADNTSEVIEGTLTLDCEISVESGNGSINYTVKSLKINGETCKAIEATMTNNGKFSKAVCDGDELNCDVVNKIITH